MYRDFDAFCDFLDDELPVFDCEERNAMWHAVCASVDGFREDQPPRGDADPSLWFRAALWACESRAANRCRERLRLLVITLAPNVLGGIDTFYSIN
jgi:hypothetical protein